jgi:hypothetical protein
MYEINSRMNLQFLIKDLQIYSIFRESKATLRWGPNQLRLNLSMLFIAETVSAPFIWCVITTYNIKEYQK